MTITYTQAPDAELVAFMNDLRAAEVRNELRETTVEWGEDTICAVCVHPLPAGATAYADNDGVLCVDCAAVELEAAGRKG